MTEGSDPALGYAWGCRFGQERGWVPFPKKVPRRHPLTDAICRTDDPCDNSKRVPSENKPEPKLKILKQGVPNAVCNLNDYEEKRSPLPDSILRGDISPDKANEVQFKLKPILNTTVEEPEQRPIEECCNEARSLDCLREKVNKLLGPEPENPWDKEEEKDSKPYNDLNCFSKNSNREEPCPPEDPLERICTDHVPTKNVSRPSPKEPFDCNKWSNWFKGYGCEKTIHPFYLTTSSSYGRFGPNSHTMPSRLFTMERKFTNGVECVGRPRNRALNLSSDKTKV